ncbi:MAG TPA: hypothetical protein VFK05_35090, partial [Polyangiaceae bacterium]|nr:hypothetical protein [Polyangiaceae bacterium]
MPETEFAARAEVSLDELQHALANELQPAALGNGLVHANSTCALEFMAKHPFGERDGKSVEPEIDCADFLAAASVPDPAHPGSL